MSHDLREMLRRFENTRFESFNLPDGEKEKRERNIRGAVKMYIFSQVFLLGFCTPMFASFGPIKIRRIELQTDLGCVEDEEASLCTVCMISAFKAPPAPVIQSIRNIHPLRQISRSSDSLFDYLAAIPKDL